MRRPVTAALLTCAAALFMPAAAWAAPSPTVVEATASAVDPPAGIPCSTGTGVTACYEADGDVFWVLDRVADGYHTDAVWSLDGQATSNCHNRLGAAAGWTFCDDLADDIPENSDITFRGWVMDADDSPRFDGTAGPQVYASTT